MKIAAAASVLALLCPSFGADVDPRRGARAERRLRGPHHAGAGSSGGTAPDVHDPTTRHSHPPPPIDHAPIDHASHPPPPPIDRAPPTEPRDGQAMPPPPRPGGNAPDFPERPMPPPPHVPPHRAEGQSPPRPPPFPGHPPHGGSTSSGTGSASSGTGLTAEGVHALPVSWPSPMEFGECVREEEYHPRGCEMLLFEIQDLADVMRSMAFTELAAGLNRIYGMGTRYMTDYERCVDDDRCDLQQIASRFERIIEGAEMALIEFDGFDVMMTMTGSG